MLLFETRARFIFLIFISHLILLLYCFSVSNVSVLQSHASSRAKVVCGLMQPLLVRHCDRETFSPVMSLLLQEIKLRVDVMRALSDVTAETRK